MRNIKLTIAYDGTCYSGWQRQKELPTIQGCVEDKISLMTCTKVILHGAGRTDAGVHALGMVANFQTESSIPILAFLKGLNSLLPKDIRILHVNEVESDFHARFWAKGKTYIYQAICSPILSPCLRLYHAHLPVRPDISIVKSCLRELVGEHDFTSFEAAGSRDLSVSGGRGAVRTILAATVTMLPDDNNCLNIEISGDGFLRHMVRNIVGTVFEVSMGRRSLKEFKAILPAKDRGFAGVTAPAKGLFLKEVFY